MEHEFNAVLEKLEGKMQWTVFYVPFSVKELYDTNGRLNVKAEIDGHSFDGTLLPSRNGHYLIYNKEIKKVCKKEIGDSIHVKMELDVQPRTIEVPDSIMTKLKENKDALIEFEKLPNYIKREQINKIMSAKREETRERRIQKFIQSLILK